MLKKHLLLSTFSADLWHPAHTDAKKQHFGHYDYSTNLSNHI